MNALAQRENRAVQRMNDGVPATLDQAVDQFRNQLSNRVDEFKMALPAHITPEKFQRTLITAVQADPELLKADRRSLILACMKAAQDGCLPDKREAALVVFKENKKVDGQWVTRLLVTYMCMVFGLRKKILQSGEIRDITAKVVYRREALEGHFIYEEGTEAMLRHKPMMDLTDEDTTDDQIVAAYSMATYMDGTKSYELMRRFEIDKVRESSQTGATKDRKGNPRNPSGPWVDWYPEQAKKTVMRRHSKTLPMSGDLLDVEAKDDALYAASASSALAIEEEQGGVVLPSRDQLDHNPETGEIIEPGEEDEETARQLDAQTDGWQEGPADEQRGEANSVTLEAAKQQIDGCELVADVNAKMGTLLNGMSEEDADELRTHAMDRIDQLKAPK